MSAEYGQNRGLVQENQRETPASVNLIGQLSVFVPGLEDPVARVRLNRVLSESTLKTLDTKLVPVFGAGTVLELKGLVYQEVTKPGMAAAHIVDKQPEPVRTRVIKWTTWGKDLLMQQIEEARREIAQNTPPWSTATDKAGRPKGPGSRKLAYRVKKRLRGPTRTILGPNS